MEWFLTKFQESKSKTENAKNSKTNKKGKTDETTSKKQLECDFEIVDLLKDVQSNINENVELQSKYDLRTFSCILKVKKLADEDIRKWAQIKACSVMVPRLTEKIASSVIVPKLTKRNANSRKKKQQTKANYHGNEKSKNENIQEHVSSDPILKALDPKALDEVIKSETDLQEQSKIKQEMDEIGLIIKFDIDECN